MRCKRWYRTSWIGLSLAVALIPASSVHARIKLITLPERQRVEIQLNHPNVTLVEEERIVPLLAGVNQVDFSWNNTTIDPDTIQFRPLENDGRIKVLSVSYPPDENALVWQVSAADSGPARVRISYIISNLNKSFEYRAAASHDESTLTLAQYMRIHNLTNENFGQAGLWAGFGEYYHRPIGMAETKQVLLAKFDDVPIEKRYLCDLHNVGYLYPEKKQLSVPMYYVIHNDPEHQLGKFPLPPGKARIFQNDRQGTSAFIGEDWGLFTPIDDELKLHLGLARDIVVIRTIERRERQRIAGNLANYDIIVKYEIENFKDSPVTLDIAETLSGLRSEIGVHNDRDVDWEFLDSGTLADRLDRDESTADRLLFRVDLPARNPSDQQADKVVHRLHILMKNEW